MDLICLIKEKYDLKKTAKSYIIDTTECGFYCPPNIAKKAMAGSLDIVDLPAVEGQLHIHNDTGHSHLKPYGNDNTMLHQTSFFVINVIF